MNKTTTVLRYEIAKCRSHAEPFHRFNSVILGRPAYWSAQREIGRAMADLSVRRIEVKSGHMTGKDFTAAGLAHGWLAMYPDSGVVIVGPKLEQVRRSTWKEFRKARAGSPLLCTAGRLSRNPMALEYDEGWLAYVTAADNPEGLQGFHPSGPVLVIVGEASGFNDPDMNQALQSLKPVKRLDIFNPLKNYGEAYEACQRAIDDPSIRVIEVPSTASPDAAKEHSDCGLADAAWLRSMALDYGADSETYKVRVLAQFPSGSADLLIPSSWLDTLSHAPYRPGGPRRLASDLGLGTGGDDSTWLVRDDNAILYFEASRFTSLGDAAEKTATLCQRYGIEDRHVSFDAAGIGADFGHRLRDRGIKQAHPFVGARRAKSKRFVNLRTAAHFAMRRRLDPTRKHDDGSERPLFHLPAAFLERFRRECRELTFTNLEAGAMQLRPAEEVKDALRHSPDYSVTLAQSFAFP